MPPERQPGTCLVIDENNARSGPDGFEITTSEYRSCARPCSVLDSTGFSWYVTATCHTISLWMLVSSELANRCSPGRTGPCRRDGNATSPSTHITKPCQWFSRKAEQSSDQNHSRLLWRLDRNDVAAIDQTIAEQCERVCSTGLSS